ncbi:MAG TPA: hypothetical protein VJQ09_05845 [Candidatus Limnocylindria bacterium]|nr:hypothetical protein [Candidatus Limnocylindria bacterium]
MRFAIAVLASGVAQSFIYLRLADWVGISAALAVTYLAFAALGAGWFAARRNALAGAMSVAVGVAIYAGRTFFGPAGTGMQILDLVLGILGLVFAYWPFILIGALAGAVGGSLRRRMLGRTAA